MRFSSLRGMALVALLAASSALVLPSADGRLGSGSTVARGLSRRDFGTAVGVACGAAALSPALGGGAALAADSDLVMRGVLQLSKDAKLTPPAGSSATITLRVVGRNTNGPLAQGVVPISEGTTFPLEFAVMRAQLREGVPDYVWEKEDIYIKADVNTAAGKELFVGRSKAKLKMDGDTPKREVAYVTLE